MKYISTRGGVAPQNFLDVVLEGLADDGGLYVPEKFPTFPLKLIEQWRGLPYQRLCFNITREFIDATEIPDADLHQIITKSYSKFRHKDISPTKQLHGNVYILELFHGPTFSFKDIALQFLGTLFSYVLEKKNQKLRVVGATSGDTGSAALYALINKPGIDCCILYPKDRTSRVQELQMTTLRARNVQCLEVTGTFDDCQALIKQAFNSSLKKDLSLGAINSINFARILAQTVYYFYAYLSLPKKDKQQVTFSVPTGNFGDALAGYYAKLMGLPINLVVATNSNDILARFFKTGAYEKFAVMPTISPSMDIQIASNFERFLFHLFDGDSKTVIRLCQEIATKGYCEVSDEYRKKAAKYLSSDSVSDKETMATINDVFTRCDYVLDPHTAVGYAGAMKSGKLDNGLIVCLATAHFGKFTDSIIPTASQKLKDAMEERMPIDLKRLEDLPKKATQINAVFTELEQHLRKSYTTGGSQETSIIEKNAIPLAIIAAISLVAGAIFIKMKK